MTTANETLPAAPEDLLLERWQTLCDREALGELLKLQRNRAYSTAYHLLGHAADAEDAVQDAFLKFLGLRKGFETPEAFRVAVYFAVLQSATDLLRRRRRHEKHETVMLATTRGMESSGGSACAVPGEAPERAERLQILREALSVLPVEQRAAVILCYQQGLSTTAAAGALSIPRQTLHDRLAKALADLRTELRRRGLVLSLAFLGSALGEAGELQAPFALCAALDRMLPGRPCEELPAPALTLPRSFRSCTAGKSIFVGTAGLLVLPLAMSLAALWPPAKNAATESCEWKNQTVAAAQSAPGTSKRSKEMGLKKWGTGLVLGAALALPNAARADEGESVSEILAQIRAHMAEKQKLASETKFAAADGEWAFMGGGVEELASSALEKEGDCPGENTSIKMAWCYFADANPQHWMVGTDSATQPFFELFDVKAVTPAGPKE